MGLSKYKLGELIELRDVRNSDLQYGLADVRGVNNLKQLMPTKADLNGRNLCKFQIVSPGEFVFNHRTSRNGSKFSIAYNNGERPIICTEDYVVFRVKDDCKQILDAIWLYMFFNRPEFDRYVITNSWGSSTEFYNWEDICSISLDLPLIDIQRKYVAVYNAVLANQQSYERGLEDLKLTIDATIEKYKGKHTEKISLEQLITECDLRNSDNKFHIVYGVNKDKLFMPTVTSGADLTKYKVVQKHQFACNLMHVGRDVAIPVALNHMAESFIISPAYLVFEINTEEIIPEFFMIWFSREETDRMAWFMCDSNIRGGMDKRRFYDMTIPVPSKKEQLALVEMYEALRIRKEINEKLKTQIKDLCPILIKGSIEEAQR